MQQNRKRMERHTYQELLLLQTDEESTEPSCVRETSRL